MPQCLISFGANLGMRDSTIVAAMRELAVHREVENFSVSRLFETPAIGGPEGQNAFLNGVAAFDTNANASDVLRWLNEIESHLGRQRERRWGARSIDLDVVLHGTLIGGSSDLTVPHPRYTARRFVVRPAVDVVPDYVDPRFGWTMRRLADHLDHGVASLAMIGGEQSLLNELCAQLTAKHGMLTFPSHQCSPLMQVLGNAPMPQSMPAPLPPESIPLDADQIDEPWVAAFVPQLVSDHSTPLHPNLVPRLIVRVSQISPEQRWPAPYRMKQMQLNWPEYRLEFEDVQWACSELHSAIDSMRCELKPVADDGNWWK